jgi:hypothetical protein
MGVVYCENAFNAVVGFPVLSKAPRVYAFQLLYASGSQYNTPNPFPPETDLVF